MLIDFLYFQNISREKNNISHQSIKKTPFQASKTVKEKEVYSNLQNKRIKPDPKFNLKNLVRTSDIRKFLIKVTVLIVAIYHKPYLKYYMIPLLQIELTICLRDLSKTYYYQQNYPWNKIIK